MKGFPEGFKKGTVTIPKTSAITIAKVMSEEQ